MSDGTIFLVDTNVLVYSYDPSDEVKRVRAISVLERLGSDQSGALSVQVLGEFFVAVTRKIKAPLSAAQAEHSLTRYARSWLVYGLTVSMVLEATRGVQRYQFSYWDALIWATAKVRAVPNVLSEDFSDGSLIEGVRFLNPLAPTFDLSLVSVS